MKPKLDPPWNMYKLTDMPLLRISLTVDTISDKKRDVFTVFRKWIHANTNFESRNSSDSFS